MCFLWIIYTGLILRSIATEVTSTHIPHRHFLKCTTDSQWTLPRWVTKSASSVWKWPSHMYATTMRLPFSLLRASTHQGLPALESFGDTLTQEHNGILILKKKSRHTSPEYWECFTTSQVLCGATKTPSFLGRRRDHTFTASYNEMNLREKPFLGSRHYNTLAVAHNWAEEQSTMHILGYSLKQCYKKLRTDVFQLETVAHEGTILHLLFLNGLQVCPTTSPHLHPFSIRSWLK